MDEPPLPPERSPPPSTSLAGCAAVGIVALVPLLYVGSFAFLVLDEWYGFGFLDSLDDGTIEMLVVVYWPLIWLHQALLGV